MSLGKATVDAQDQGQGAFPTIEKYFLFVGVAPINVGSVLFLNTDSNLTAELGATESELKTQVAAARLNAGQGWACAAMPIANAADWESAVDAAMNQNLSVEAVVICAPVTSGTQLTAMQAKAESISATYQRLVYFLATTPEIDNEVGGDSWADYVTANASIVNGINAERVLVAPSIFKQSLGILAGRLCHYSTSVADTPMRVSTGPLVGVGFSDLPTDKNGVIYNNAYAKSLNDLRFSVCQLYSDYPGIYWSDATTLAVPTSDYSVLENLRVVDKAARRVRLVLIGLIGNRQLNSTPAGEALGIVALMRPLREMSRSIVFAGIQYPAELQPPKDGDIVIAWETRTRVKVFMKARPFDIPKELEAHIVLDLSVGA